MTTWEKVPDEVVEMANHLIDAHHLMLGQARIGILFRDKPSRSKGKTVIGKALLVSDRWKPLLEEELDFVIWLAFDVWNEVLSEEQKIAVLDHELSHCTMDGEGKPKLRAHHFEEFTWIIERHGFWNESLIMAASAIQSKQLPLDIGMSRGEGIVLAMAPASMPG